MDKTQSAWMKFLKPVAAGLIVLMSAATAYLQRHDSANIDSRVTALEVQNEKCNRFQASTIDFTLGIAAASHWGAVRQLPARLRMVLKL